MDIYCTRPNCPKPVNACPDLDTGGTIKTISQKFCVTCGMPLFLAGRYLTEKPLARGGFGAAYIARDRYTPAMRRCVVKQLMPLGLTGQQLEIAKQMFDREGEVLERLGTHPQIPDLLAFFEVQAGKDNFFYLVQEFIDGFTLEQLVEQHGAIAEADVVEIMSSLLPVLQFVHDHGSIHRDIKPSNIMIRKADQTYFLLDFGAVKQVTAAAAGQKSTGIFTPGYGAPEQMRGDKVFPSSDLYAFAVTCLYLLTGKEPDDLFDVNTNKWNWHSAIAVNPDLVRLLDRMLETAPNMRFESAKDVLDALKQIYAPTSQTLTQPSQTSISAPSQVPVSAPPAVVTPPPAPASRRVASASPPPVQAARQVPASPSATPWLLSAPLGNQLFAAFLIGFEGMLLGLVAYYVGFAQIGMQPSLLILGGVVLSILWLRISQILDNKDLLIFVNVGTILAVVGLQLFAKLPQLQSLPSLENMALMSAIAGFATVTCMALFRLIFQLLYSFL
ncbi:serine/threonine-protein kinase [Tumidithrix elongata RA019]|uniref:non-specific serine/threonine protein kinase n=1 Tax=Tumidithrix elongata BACA0141 TaxID=2716417 RepID=A0AAW9Q0G9_9CYAN|nr:serine/threonine-protein kinase [Tumidithrix elongata RA019]